MVRFRCLNCGGDFATLLPYILQSSRGIFCLMNIMLTNSVSRVPGGEDCGDGTSADEKWMRTTSRIRDSGLMDRIASSFAPLQSSALWHGEFSITSSLAQITPGVCESAEIHLTVTANTDSSNEVIPAHREVGMEHANEDRNSSHALVRALKGRRDRQVGQSTLDLSPSQNSQHCKGKGNGATGDISPERIIESPANTGMIR
ncbi:hypothetical protein EX30DRAFT_352783 [Ascodesmis nigricans]|uniref:Uncharacterized protein n=1 Tax=Ascodesmis nigricans TaxID=341454 RepID=A0A4S2MPH8_9PEZI|nr:hypothetical protein EX30DRAFT_352783 [Ascodesmis nigricans]